jgi:hypothetical protein
MFGLKQNAANWIELTNIFIWFQKIMNIKFFIDDSVHKIHNLDSAKTYTEPFYKQFINALNTLNSYSYVFLHFTAMTNEYRHDQRDRRVYAEDDVSDTETLGSLIPLARTAL